jgi:Kef-type K+ transport system membrane component KefB
MTDPFFATSSILHFGQYSKLFFDLALIMITVFPLTWLCRRLHQPIVIGEIIAGLILGPTVFGGVAKTIFPAAQQTELAAMAQIGVVIFMFMMGLDVDLEQHWRSSSPFHCTRPCTTAPVSCRSSCSSASRCR